MLPILLVEDEEPSEVRFKILLKRVSSSLDVRVNVHYARDYREAIEKASCGTYPLAIVDLALRDPLAGADQDLAANKFRGLDVIALVHKHNRDSVVGVYTAYVQDTAPAFVNVHVDELLSKTELDDVLVAKLSELVQKAVTRYNYTIDPYVEDALRWGFGGAPPWGKQDQWELCLRRFHRTARESVVYNSVGKGRGGAGIVVVYADNHLPKILKLNLYKKLYDEVDRYDKYVKDYIPKRALTSQDDLAQAGEVGILSYSFVGLEYIPTTLAQAITQHPPEQIVRALSDYFNINCERWFARGGTPIPYDLASKCREHFKPESEKIREMCLAQRAKLAAERAVEYLQDCTSSQLIDIIIDAVNARRKQVLCKPEVIVHGDLNANNLVWENGNLWMIDFAKTTNQKPRLLDFVKLEASVKFDVPTAFKTHLLDEDKVLATLSFEDKLLSAFQLDEGGVCNNLDMGLRRKFMAISAIRSCAKDQCGREPEIEYWLALFFVTAKHVQYLAEDITKSDEAYVPLVHALVSAYRLAKMLETTVMQ